jgi:hypothetical protein
MDDILPKKPRKFSDIKDIQGVQEDFNWDSIASKANRGKVDDILSEIQLYDHYFLTKKTIMSALGMEEDPVVSGSYITLEADHEEIHGIELALSIENGELKFYFKSVNKNGELVGSHTPIGREP